MTDSKSLDKTGIPVARCLIDTDRERITIAYVVELHKQHSPLAEDPHILSQLLSQAQIIMNVIDAMIGRMVAANPGSVEDFPYLDRDVLDVKQVSLEIGADRADAGISPAHSLAAGTTIFVAAQPVVIECLTRLGIESPEIVAGVIVQQAIMDRISAAATTYIDYLLVKVHRSHKDERRRLARELHDLAAPAVVLALQNLDMYSILRDSDPVESERRFLAVRDGLLEAIRVIHDLAAQSREAVARGGLRHAVTRYIRTIPAHIRTDIAINGDLDPIPESYCEELYLIIREAIRNAVTHGDPRTVTINFDMNGNDLTVLVTDDGCGFDTDIQADDGRHIGLFAMRERAELLGGELSIGSAIGAGTRVRMQVALPDRRAHQIVLARARRR